MPPAEGLPVQTKSTLLGRLEPRTSVPGSPLLPSMAFQNPAYAHAAPKTGAFNLEFNRCRSCFSERQGPTQGHALPKIS